MELYKYPNSPYMDFSPGKDNADKTTNAYLDIIKSSFVITEKLDDNNAPLSKKGVHQKSDVINTTSNAFATKTYDLWNRIYNDIDDGIIICGGNMYAVHSIEYTGLTSHYYIFGIFDENTNTWLSWSDTEYYANYLNIPTVPVLYRHDKHIHFSHDMLIKVINELMSVPSKLSDDRFRLVKSPSIYDSSIVLNDKLNTNLYQTPKEGIVLRNDDSFLHENFNANLVKYVRAHHVQTDKHWTKMWRKSKLVSQLDNELIKSGK